MNNVKDSNRQILHKITTWITTILYCCASLSLILASFSLVGISFYELFDSVLITGPVNKDIIQSITYTVIAIAVCDVGRYLIEEEVEQEKKLHSPAEARRTVTRFMVVVAIALSLEGLVGVFEMGNKDIRGVLFPLAIALSAVVVLIGLGVYQRLSAGIETKLQKAEELSADNDQN